MRLLTRIRHEEKEELGVSNQGITPPLEVVHKHPFAGSRYTKGECSKVSESSETLMESTRKENDGNTYPSSHDSDHCRERAEASSHRHTDIRDNKGRYNHFQSSNVHFDYDHVVNNERRSRHQKTCTFCGLPNHTFSKCWKRMATLMRHERPSQPHEKKQVKQV